MQVSSFYVNVRRDPCIYWLNLLAALVLAVGIVAFFYPMYTIPKPVAVSSLSLAKGEMGCINGGTRIIICQDTNSDGECSLSEDAILADKVVCHGEVGSSIGMNCTAIPENSTTCEFGGWNILWCQDVNMDGFCSAEQGDLFLNNKTLCSGGSGPRGIGIGITSSLIICPNEEMGQQITFCRDLNGDGQCSELDSELQVVDLCNGTMGLSGLNGTNGLSFGVEMVESLTCTAGGIVLIFCQEVVPNSSCQDETDVFLFNRTLCNPTGLALEVTNSTTCPFNASGTQLTVCHDLNGDGLCTFPTDENIVSHDICDGSPGTSGLLCPNYLFSIQIGDADPGDRFVRFNNANQTLTTQLYISTTDVDNRETGEILLLATAGSYIFVRSITQPTSYYLFFVAEDPILVGGIGGYVRFPLVILSGEGTTSLGQGEALFICFQLSSQLTNGILVSQASALNCPSGGTEISFCPNYRGDLNCSTTPVTETANVCNGINAGNPYFGTDYQAQTIDSSQAISLTSFTNYLTLTTTNLTGGTYLVQWQWETVAPVLSASVFSLVCFDGSAADCSDGSLLTNPDLEIAALGERHMTTGFTNLNMGAGVHTVHLSHRRGALGGTNPTVDNRRVVMWRVL